MGTTNPDHHDSPSSDGALFERAGASARRLARAALQFLADAACWAVAVPMAKAAHYHGFRPVDWSETAILAAVLIGVHLLAGLSLGLYRARFRYGSLDELAKIMVTVLATVGVGWMYVEAVSDVEAREMVPLIAGSFTTLFMIGVRTLRRMYLRQMNRSADDPRVLVVGAGDAARAITRVLLDSPSGRYRPVAMLDDDAAKRNLRLHGVRVMGALADLQAVAGRVRAEAVLFAIPSAPTELIRAVRDDCDALGLPMFMLPPVADMFSQPLVTDIRPVSEDDLLGRDRAVIDTEAVEHYITGRRVLVTGAGGSIGSELCRQLAQLHPSSLVMLDRDESALAAVQLSILGRTELDARSLVLADIRDAERMRQVFLEHRPQVVFHAAALKHLALLEQAPDEAWKTNVFGTHHVLSAAAEVGVDHFVNISTDKAANPSSVLGMSKRITERLTAGAAIDAPGNYVSVRFGNVLGSRGSVLTIFGAQAEAGGPLTVTHPEVTRYFMTVQEAVRLTIYAGAIGHTGECLVLDMGQPVRILDVAKRFARQQPVEMPIVFTGLRAGEKLHEDLFGPYEGDERPVHPLVSHVTVPPLSIESVRTVYEVADLPSINRMFRLNAENRHLARWARSPI